MVVVTQIFTCIKFYRKDMRRIKCTVCQLSFIYCFYALDSFCFVRPVMMDHSPLNIIPLPVGIVLSTVSRQH